MSRKLTLEDLRLWGRVKSSVASGFNGAVTPLRAPYNPVLDLHGVQIHPAYFRVKEHIAEAKIAGHRKLTVITGKSGPINLEFEHWLQDRPDIRKIAVKNGGGAYDIWLKKDSSTPTR